jgi:cell division protein ZapA
MAEKHDIIQVEIFGQVYSVRAGPDPAYLQQLAAYVDEQMREVNRTTGPVDSVRIAVLAALNIADERFRLKERIDEAESRARGRLDALTRELAAALEE